MKKRLALIPAALALTFALLTPTASLAGSSYTFSVVDQHCIPGGNGHNPYFRVKVTAAGTTPATKLTIKSTSQYLSGGTWHNYYQWSVDKNKFTADGTAHSLDVSYDHVDGSDTRKWRIKSVLKALQGKHYLDGKTLTSKAC